MISMGALWLPILLAAVFVFIASSIIHLVLQYHKTNFGKVPQEDELLATLKKLDIAPGQYMVPRAESAKQLGDPDFRKKFEEGPTGFLIVGPRAAPTMGTSLLLWFFYCLLIGLLTAYIAAVTLPVGVKYLTVFRVTGTAAILGYGGATLSESIWMKRSWSHTLKNVFDSVVYGLITAGTFSWLWPS